MPFPSLSLRYLLPSNFSPLTGPLLLSSHLKEGVEQKESVGDWFKVENQSLIKQDDA